MPTANVVRFGPGKFTLGAAPGADYGCQVKSLAVNVATDKGDPTTTLCGDVVAGSRVYNYTLTGTVLQDFGAVAGFQQYSWEHKGESVPFTFTPSDAAVTAISGAVLVDPTNVGDSGAVFGDLLTVDFEWDTDGEPDITWPAGP